MARTPKLTPYNAVILGKTCIISDLHLGIENVMVEKGFSVPRMQIPEIVDDIRRIVRTYSPKRIVIAGDLKHEFSRNLPYEWEDVGILLEELSDLEVIVVRGNHDNFLPAILSKYGVEMVDELEVHGWMVVHGHKECDGDRIIMGHEHPAVKIRYRGAVYDYKCYIRVKGSIIVLPAFSPIVTGVDLLSSDGFLSPILKGVRDDDVEVYAICGEVVYLGRLSDLKSVGPFLR